MGYHQYYLQCYLHDNTKITDFVFDFKHWRAVSAKIV